MSDERGLSRKSIALMRARLFEGYQGQRYTLEKKMGFEPSFEDWLVVQLTMFSVFGKPDEYGSRPV